ncbi:c-type cytochrome [Paenirhodobacter sp. CAU 1674]|jgi:cytochrome c553|uniref:c-type cytochrome n=1 Tax=Paenirhodobacter sp. CAU 1674 TaxID=3032596 RepID=UPI0023DA44FE|nr:c-type cytochrome [Paenirhodobacter sp. CAU 1674]MDF2141841.1 c-type cytochrome [Paenirhodobacter sp. CAU 1674]
MRPIFKSLLVAAVTLAALPALADAVEDGEKVYKTKTCMACHGIKGARPVLSYPMLAGQNEKYLLTQLKDIKAGKRVGSNDPDTGHPYVQGMVDIMHLVDDNDLKNVAKYLSQLPPGKPKAMDPPPAPDLLAAGEKAYNSLGCKSCHGKDGMKPTAKNYPFIAGLNAEYLARQMTEMRDKVRVNGQSKLMFGTIKKASDEDIIAMSAWLSQLNRAAE